MTYWQRWVSRPQTTWLRKAIFQIHLWSGIVLGLYVAMISATGSVLVYTNEIYRAATRDPIIATGTGPTLTDDQLKASAMRAYPGYTILRINRARNPDEAIGITLERGPAHEYRLFHPYTGADLGETVPLGIKMVSQLLKLHDDLLGGTTGRRVNGAGALLIVVMALTGRVVWWPGVKTWRRSLTIQRNVGWPRLIWSLHGMVGFWTLGFVLIFGLSGIYLSNPELFQDLADKIQPLTVANSRSRTVDQVIYWLAYLHFGRINGIGIPCKGPGLCDMTTKFLWAFFGLAPAGLFVTGAVMWWNRVLGKKFKRFSRQNTMQVPPL